MNRLEKEAINPLAGSLSDQSEASESAEESNSNMNSKALNILKSEKMKGYGMTLAYFVIAFVTYSIAITVLPVEMAFFVRHFIGLILTFLFLAAVAKSQKNRSGNASAIVIFVIMIFVFNISRHYFVPGEMEANNYDNTIGISTKTIEKDGIYTFKLKAGESTGWIGFLEEKTVDVSYSSPDYDYRLFYSDNTDYPGGPKVSVPEKKHCYVNVKANSDQFITMKVTYN